jgi:hypothetical protein
MSKEKLNEMLAIADLHIRPSYRPNEVCLILGISERTLRRYTDSYEKDEFGLPRHPASLDSYLLHRERRVSYQELAAFLSRNQTWERRHAEDPRQLLLFPEFEHGPSG